MSLNIILSIRYASLEKEPEKMDTLSREKCHSNMFSKKIQKIQKIHNPTVWIQILIWNWRRKRRSCCLECILIKGSWTIPILWEYRNWLTTTLAKSSQWQSRTAPTSVSYTLLTIIDHYWPLLTIIDHYWLTIISLSSQDWRWFAVFNENC